MAQVSIARSKPRQAGVQPSSRRWLTHVAFVLSLALVACRLLMPESIRNSIDPLAALGSPQAEHTQQASAPVQTPSSPGPAAGLVLDLLFCLPALLVITRRAADGDYQLLYCASVFPMALLAMLAVCSPIWAADKFASAVSAAHFFCALVFIWSTLQLVRSWGQLRLIAGLCIGLLLALSLVGYNYHEFEQPELKKTFEQNENAILIAHKFQPGTYEAQMFKNRIDKAQPMGYSTSTNTYAALLVMLGIIAAGVVIQQFARFFSETRHQLTVIDGLNLIWIVVPLLATAAIPALVVWTSCRAAFVTPVIAALILLLLWPMRGWLLRHSRAAYLAVVLGIAGVAGFVIFYGWRTGTLKHDSLTFRWRYWVGSYKVLTDGFYHASRSYGHFLFGVGWENFGSYYLAQRLPKASEEIRDPHNFIVRVFVELGVAGGILLLVWMLRLWWDFTRAFTPAEILPASPAGRAKSSHPQRPASSSRGPGGLLSITAIACVAIAANIVASTYFSSGGWYFVLQIAWRGLCFVMLFVGMISAALRASADENSSQIKIVPDNRSAPWLLYAVLAALATFLIHNLIEFSLFEPGPMFLFALLSGAVLGLRAEGHRQAAAIAAPEKTRGLLPAKIALAVGAMGWCVAVVFFVTPVVVAESYANDAENDAFAFVNSHDPHSLLQAEAEITEAAHWVPYNADYAHHAAALRYGTGDPLRVKEMLDAAIATDPTSVRDFVMRAQLEIDRLHDFDAGLRDYRAAVMLDPRNVRMRVEFARALARVARLTHRPNLAGDAWYQYERALQYDNDFAADEVKRLTAPEKDEIRKGQAQAVKEETAQNK